MDKLLDFDYSDDNIFSLRQQMKLPVSLISMRSPSIGKISDADLSIIYIFP